MIEKSWIEDLRAAWTEMTEYRKAQEEKFSEVQKIDAQQRELAHQMEDLGYKKAAATQAQRFGQDRALEAQHRFNGSAQRIRNAGGNVEELVAGFAKPPIEFPHVEKKSRK